MKTGRFIAGACTRPIVWWLYHDALSAAAMYRKSAEPDTIPAGSSRVREDTFEKAIELESRTTKVQ
jgi:hypothetical protein